jgi:hypothetical protein
VLAHNPPIVIVFGDVSPEGDAVFPAGVPPGTYDVLYAGFDPSLVVDQLGTIQIGNCAPTNKDQCKNGGWRNYPQFKNQGQCIAFVNRDS